MEEAASNETQKARQLEEQVKELSATVEELRSQLAWFRRNMFGRKSEQMPNDPEAQVEKRGQERMPLI